MLRLFLFNGILLLLLIAKRLPYLLVAFLFLCGIIKSMKQKKNTEIKRFIVRKYVMARSAQEALRKERKLKPDDCWVDDEYKKEGGKSFESCIGFDNGEYPE